MDNRVVPDEGKCAHAETEHQQGQVKCKSELSPCEGLLLNIGDLRTGITY